MMRSFPSAEELAQLTMIVVGGRVLLAWLPPGVPGSHQPRELAHTLAASALLGIAGLMFAVVILPERVMPWAWIGALILLGLVRILTRPHGLMPRHEPAQTPSSSSARIALALAWIALFLTLIARSGAGGFGVPGVPYALLSAAVLIEWAVVTARGAHVSRAATLTAFAALVYFYPETSDWSAFLCASLFAAGGAASVAWFRRADRRALCLAAVFFAAAMPFARGAWALATAGAVVLWFGTPAPSRAYVLAVVAGAVALGAAAAWTGEIEESREWRGEFTPLLAVLVALLFVPVVLARWRDMRRGAGDEWNPSGARVGHERAMLSRMIVLALILALVARQLDGEVHAELPLLPGLLALVLLSGMSLGRIVGRT